MPKTTAPKPSPRAERLLAPARALWGSRWQSPLARATGLSQQLLGMIALGRRDVTDEVEFKILAAYLAEQRGRVADFVGGVSKIVRAREAA